MPVSNETLLVQIGAVKDLLVDLRDRDIVGICERLDAMNGRQRELTARVSDNAGSIETLQWRTGQVESGLKNSMNWRTFIMGLFSTAQSFTAYILSK
jgi:hypothetical protein